MRIEIVWEPIYHIGGAQLLALPMIRDVSLAMVDRFSASRFWSQVKEEGASHIHYLGRILQILLEQSPSPLDRSTARTAFACCLTCSSIRMMAEIAVT